MEIKKRAARYALRRTLPPWRFDECIAELLDFCQQAFVDEVILKRMLRNLATASQRLNGLNRINRRCKRHGMN